MKTQIQTFADFKFSNELNRAITDLGFETPTQIQIETIPVLMNESTDFLGLASTGTGKTAAFAIPLLEKINPKTKGVQGLILCPTRELAKQVSEQINLLARYKNTKALAIYGGSDYGGQLRALKEGVSIVVGTPGRIIDHIERKTLNLDLLQTVVLDEADEMISMGFREEIEFILQTINQEEKHQTWLFSATMSPDVRKIADQFLDNPRQVQVNKTTGVAASVTQYFFQVYEENKPEVVESLIDSVPEFYGLIFCQTKQLVIELTQSLRAHGYPADCLHGDMEQAARERTMKAFKAKQVTIMVCTDVASRGIDVKELTHVLNYSIPRELDLYVHRIGRTGRGGKEGVAWNLVSPMHRGLLSRIERVTRTQMIPAKVPDQKTILTTKIAKALTEFQQLSDAPSIQALLTSGEWKTALETMSKEEIVARFLSKTIKLAAPQKKSKEGKGGFVSAEPRESRFQERREGKRAFGKRDFGKKREFGDRDFGKKRDFGSNAKKKDKKLAGSVRGNGKSKPPTFDTFKH